MKDVTILFQKTLEILVDFLVTLLSRLIITIIAVHEIRIFIRFFATFLQNLFVLAFVTFFEKENRA